MVPFHFNISPSRIVIRLATHKSLFLSAPEIAGTTGYETQTDSREERDLEMSNLRQERDMV